MSTEEQRIGFINATMDVVHNLCDDLYEALVDYDTTSVYRIIDDLNEILQDLNQTFQDEI